MRRPISTLSLGLPGLGWFFCFLILPLILVFAVSFLTKGTYGGVQLELTLTNYQKISQLIYLQIFLKSLSLALITAFVCTALGLFMAWGISTSSEEFRPYWIAALMIPFMTNLVIRVYSLKLFVGLHGPLQWLLSTFQIPFDPFYLTANPFLMSFGLISCYLPFAVFPLYSAFEKFDFTLIEAAQDLGARHVQVLLLILVPLLKPALLYAFALVFIPCLGEFIIPDLLGGAKQMLLGNLITDTFLKARNWPLGSALAVVLFLILILSFLTFKDWKKSCD